MSYAHGNRSLAPGACSAIDHSTRSSTLLLAPASHCRATEGEHAMTVTPVDVPIFILAGGLGTRISEEESGFCRYFCALLAKLFGWEDHMPLQAGAVAFCALAGSLMRVLSRTARERSTPKLPFADAMAGMLAAACGIAMGRSGFGTNHAMGALKQKGGLEHHTRKGCCGYYSRCVYTL